MISGRIKISSAKKKVIVNFDRVAVVGRNETEIRKHFIFTSCFPKKDFEKIKGMVAKGEIELLDFTILKQLGNTEYDVPEEEMQNSALQELNR